jgi:LacI family repressor for deo operon, udp, cdd, tsx, nupC, and nupG
MPATMLDVARLAGVSTATVSRVLNTPELVNEDTRRRVMNSIQQLDYKINVAARRLRTNQTRLIAVVIPTIAEPVINQIVEAIEDAAIEQGYTLLLCSTRGDMERERAYIDLLNQQMAVDGVLYVSPRAAPKDVCRLVQGPAPLVLCNYTLDDPAVPCVGIDHVSSIYQATRHLIELGHRMITLLNLAAPYYQPARMRRRGYERAMAESGLPLDPARIIEIHQPTYETGDWRAVIERLLDQPDRPTAIVAFNDEVALEVYAACRARGLCIPADVSVTGCDDTLLARYADPPLTTVRIPAYELGRQAMQHLLRCIAGKPRRGGTIPRLAVELVIRESCAPPAQK